MEKDYQNNNSISDAANNNEESNKPEHEIKVEIVSIEVVGEDTPPKHSKKYERWGTTALLSFFVWVASIGYCAYNPLSIYGVLALIVTSALFFLSIGQMVFLSSEE